MIDVTILIIIGSDYVDPEDPATMAETELLNAAASIEMAAKKLEKLKPKQARKVGYWKKNLYCNLKEYSKQKITIYLQTADESLNFEEQIIEAAKSITSATALLIKCATVAQRELVEQGKVIYFLLLSSFISFRFLQFQIFVNR